MGIPRNWKPQNSTPSQVSESIGVPPLWGSLEIGNEQTARPDGLEDRSCSPFVGIPRNWKHTGLHRSPPDFPCSPFVGIPRNWKLRVVPTPKGQGVSSSPFVGIPRNWKPTSFSMPTPPASYPGSPFVGIPRNWKPVGIAELPVNHPASVPPLWGSLEIGNSHANICACHRKGSELRSPFVGIPRNWKPHWLQQT